MDEVLQREIFSKNLSHYLYQSGKTQKEVADAIGVSTQTFNTWVKGKALPRMGKLQKLADYLMVGKSALIEPKPDPRTKEMYPLTASPKRIPVLGSVAAGVPIEMIEDIVDEVEIPGKWDGEHFGLVIHGDSMEPKISDGDIVIVKKQDYIDNGQIGIITVNGEDATCKHIFKYADTLVLRSNNPKYDEMVYTKEQVEALPVRILGRVVELRAKF